MIYIELMIIIVGIVFTIGIFILVIWADDDILKDYKIKRLNKKLNENNIETWNKQYKKFKDYSIDSSSIYHASHVSFSYDQFIHYANVSDIDLCNNAITYDKIKEYFDNQRITIFNDNDLIIFTNMKFDNTSNIDNCDFIINKNSNAEIKIFKGETGLCLSFKFIFVRGTRIYFNTYYDYRKYCIWLEELIQCYIIYNREKNFQDLSNTMIDKSKICLTKQTDIDDIDTKNSDIYCELHE